MLRWNHGSCCKTF